MVVINKRKEEGSAPNRKRIGILLLPKFQGSVLQGVLDPIVWVNKLYNRYEYKSALMSFDGNPVNSWHGFETPVQYSIGDAPSLDSLVVIGESQLTDFSQHQLLSWLRAMGRQGLKMGGNRLCGYDLCGGRDLQWLQMHSPLEPVCQPGRTLPGD